MSAWNVVRFRVKPRQEQAFEDAHRDAGAFPGCRRVVLVRTGDHAWCVIGEWDSMADLVAARPAMIRRLDGIRHLLEDLGHGLGLTDPVSGEAVLTLT